MARETDENNLRAPRRVWPDRTCIPHPSERSHPRRSGERRESYPWHMCSSQTRDTRENNNLSHCSSQSSSVLAQLPPTSQPQANVPSPIMLRGSIGFRFPLFGECFYRGRRANLPNRNWKSTQNTPSIPLFDIAVFCCFICQARTTGTWRPIGRSVEQEQSSSSL